ncbi:MAG: carbonic anhydrase family protein [Planctomycetota bacterium]
MKRSDTMSFALRTIAAAGIATSLATLVGCESTANVADGSDVMTAEAQQSLTPDAILAAMKAGNARFVSGNLTERNWQDQAKATASGQFPHSVVLSCLDSRVPPEIIFDQGIGDIFVGRVAGNFENTDMVGSMEFATAAAGSKLIIVMGHTSCGAVIGAIEDVRLGNLTDTLANIRPAIAAAGAVAGQGKSSDASLVARVTELNVQQTVADIQSRSPVLAERVANGQLKVVGAVYDLETGVVTFLDS